MSDFPTTPLIKDFWRVNSYGYPSIFSPSEQSRNAWRTFCSFFDFKKYDELKQFWASDSAPWRLSSHAVESWKATFEEFGLLFVESGSNRISVTKGGDQLRAAGDSGNLDQFTWIGLNLLVRYPLRGVRRPKSETHGSSDLLLYRFFYAALLDLSGFVWWSELERILCRVFLTVNGPKAVADILRLRKDPRLLTMVPLPVSERHGVFYNSLNQVAVHAGMNHLTLGVDTQQENPYGASEPKRLHFIPSERGNLIRRVLNLDEPAPCTPTLLNVQKLPTAPKFETERDYFDYLGAAVPPWSEAAQPLVAINLQGDVVLILRNDTDYQLRDANSIRGVAATLCQLARGQRIILSHDKKWTYIVDDKNAVHPGEIVISVRRGRPITNFAPVAKLLG